MVNKTYHFKKTNLIKIHPFDKRKTGVLVWFKLV